MVLLIKVFEIQDEVEPIFLAQKLKKLHEEEFLPDEGWGEHRLGDGDLGSENGGEIDVRDIQSRFHGKLILQA